ncbi:Hypothetical protein PHPALM_37946 [Phytophthora palmivora]|uniref:Reverse transcriptase Ty1/copia-type domain-containing protein n=1 Tax=Phytophthora palmivora TaxID=4796 RepID=A0A2P4WW50_9STRA|nr:Hypothetical protein PHPALM_37946 [Phytophthora palmivora]
MKGLGELHYLLNMEINRDLNRKTLYLSQRQYIQDLLEKFQMRYCPVKPTSQAKSVVLEKEETLTPEQIVTQPYDLQMLSKSLNTHWRVAQRVLKYYLKATSTYCIEYNGIALLNSSCTQTRASRMQMIKGSITDYVSILASQDCISLNNAESELVAASEDVQEEMWLRLLLKITVMCRQPNATAIIQQ